MKDGLHSEDVKSITYEELKQKMRQIIREMYGSHYQLINGFWGELDDYRFLIYEYELQKLVLDRLKDYKLTVVEIDTALKSLILEEWTEKKHLGEIYGATGIIAYGKIIESKFGEDALRPSDNEPECIKSQENRFKAPTYIGKIYTPSIDVPTTIITVPIYGDIDSLNSGCPLYFVYIKDSKSNDFFKRQ